MSTDNECPIRTPTLATLAKYGLSLVDWQMIAHRQGYVCAICGRLPESGRLAIDHEHVQGWKKMPATERRRYVRGLVCFICNGKCVSKHVTIAKARRIVIYLSEHSARKEKA